MCSVVVKLFYFIPRENTTALIGIPIYVHLKLCACAHRVYVAWLLCRLMRDVTTTAVIRYHQQQLRKGYLVNSEITRIQDKRPSRMLRPL